MAKSMVVVESPAKARTIGKYLGKEFWVEACSGHIKDLPKQALGVDVDHDFRATYRVISGKKKIVDRLRQRANQSGAVYLAADPDREGEAICQHLSEVLGQSPDRPIHRILFNEITKPAILSALQHPSTINQDKVAAQQARRILDRLVGYKISPLLWRNVRRGLSAGRVQSVALRMVVDREQEIRQFQSEEYWNFTAVLRAQLPPGFTAKAVELDGKKFKIINKVEADRLMEDLKGGPFRVEEVERKEKTRRPVPPFITSKLQQEASRRFRFSVKKTMTLAQRLYEGIDLGPEGSVGLITYMRTDSTRVSDLAVQEARDLVEQSLGKAYLPAKPPKYRSQKTAQEAHEAIRPTSVFRRPEDVKPYLGREEHRLYDLIWKRFVASQMSPALFDETKIDISAPRTLFRAVGTIQKFDGFLRIYREDQEQEASGDEDNEGRVLPEVKSGEQLAVEEILPEQKFTQPPPRYTEAGLVKALEEKGIGRPSTYSQIITVIQDREYVRKEEGRFIPTEIGEVVSELLVKHFREVFDYDYTARLEKNLDEIESGQKNWVSTLKEFYSDFSRELEHADEGMKNLKREETPAGIQCEKCGSQMVIKWGRFGRFVACSNYPECRTTLPYSTEDKGTSGEEASSEVEPCEQCGRPMVLRKGRYGNFYACTGYPECKNTRRLVAVNGKTEPVKDQLLEEACPDCGSQLALKTGRYGPFTACSNYPKCRYIKQETTGVSCPECGTGEMVQKKSRRGKVFYSCNRYPECRFILWNKPVDKKCPECGSAYLLERTTKKEGLILTCNTSGCPHREVLEPAVSN